MLGRDCLSRGTAGLTLFGCDHQTKVFDFLFLMQQNYVEAVLWHVSDLLLLCGFLLSFIFLESGFNFV